MSHQKMHEAGWTTPLSAGAALQRLAL